MIDIHTHLLPGVDDGSPSIEASVPVLERFRQDGVTVLVCTPHLKATDAMRAPVERHRKILAELVRHAPPLPELVLGWEIMLDAPGADLRSPDLHLGDSLAALVEFPRMHVPPGATQEILRIRMSGVTPVIAHPERYHLCTPQVVREWRSVGAVIQMDAVDGVRQCADVAARTQAARGGADRHHRERHARRRALAAHGARLARGDRCARAGGASLHRERAAAPRPAGGASRHADSGNRPGDALETPLNVHEARMSDALVGALRELAETALATAASLEAEMVRAADMVRATVAAGGTLFFCGNGGSAADAQHLATEYVVRYMRDRRAYPAIALTTDTSLLTAAATISASITSSRARSRRWRGRAIC